MKPEPVYTGAYATLATCVMDAKRSMPVVVIRRPLLDGAMGDSVINLTIAGAKDLQNELREAVDACMIERCRRKHQRKAKQ